MTQPVHILASKLLGQSSELNLIAENIANVNSTGFKRLLTGYETTTARDGLDVVGDYVNQFGTVIDHSQGGIQATNNPLDVALTTEGYFGVQTAGGATVYTRNGHFRLGANGTLEDTNGRAVLDNAGVPISLPADAQNIMIATDGTISSDVGLIAQLGVFTFSAQDTRTLTRAGGNAFAAPATATATPALDPMVQQGFLESANVNSITEVVRMQELNRSYQSALRAVQSIEDVENRAIRNIAAQA